MRKKSSAWQRQHAYGRQLSLNLLPGTSGRQPGTKRRRALKLIVEESLARVRPFLPPRSRNFVEAILTESPTEIFPVEARDTKHGDFMREPGMPYGCITLNACGNPYQFLLTLLHELAHARVAMRYRRHVKPHGDQWKAEFSNLLFRCTDFGFLPHDLQRAFRKHADAPKSTADYDTELQLALRAYDTLDERMLVIDLPDGEYFSLDGRTILRKGKLARRRIHCTSTDGHTYSVLPAARVKEVYPLRRGSSGARSKGRNR